MKRENKITVILGKKGYGKTSYVISKTDDLTRLVIFDYNREYQKGKLVTNPQQLMEQMRLNREGSFRLIYRPNPEMDIDDHFHFFCEICCLVQNQTVICEEVDLFSSAGAMPKGLKKLINYGRHHAISLLAISRRANMVPRDLTANADVIVSFNQQEPRDVKYLTDYMGHEAGEKVRGLARTDQGSEFIEWENMSLKIGKINFVDKKIFY